jgi:D-psicose/D-tagatose/L-ribulose 3-epimerase
MKIGFNMLLWTPHVTEEHFPLFEKLKETGYDGVELEVFEGTPDHYHRISEELTRLGLERTAVTIVPDEAHNPISANPDHRRAALDHIKWAIDCSEALGAELLCGPFYQPLGCFSGTGPTADEKDWAAEVHRKAAEYGLKHGVFLAVEPLNRFECYFLNTIADGAAHVARVNHANFGLQYDTFHANIEEKDPIGCLEQHLPVIRHVHISENDRGTPGKGHVPWSRVFDVLKRGGYDRWLTIEAFGRTLPDLAATTCVWRELSTGNHEVYTEGYKLIRDGWEA